MSFRTKLALLVTVLILSAVAGLCIAIDTGEFGWTILALPLVAFVLGIGA